MIIKSTKGKDTQGINSNIFPDHFVSETKKQSPDYIKQLVDYFCNAAHAQHHGKYKRIKKNYDILKGILTPEDYYEVPEVKSFVDTLVEDALPPNVVHYSILNPIVNTLVGEQSRRPDQAKVKAMDEDSRNQELEFRKEAINQLLIQTIQETVAARMQINGEEANPEIVQKKTAEEVEKDIISYTSKAEKWANKTLEALKVRFNIKELSEEAFGDLLRTATQYYHVFEDASKIGFNVKVVNPANKGGLGSPDGKYTSNVSGHSGGEYASWIIETMELSQIIEELPLTKKEIDNLRDRLADNFNIERTGRNSFDTKGTGPNTVQYDTHDPLITQERMLMESQLAGGYQDSMDALLGINSSISTYGDKFIVIRGYVLSKKKVGKLTVVNEAGELNIIPVDESYQTVPNEVDIEWSWINQWYKFFRVGSEVYSYEPFDFLPYNPIIGVQHEAKNTQVKSLVDIGKPWQIIFNLAMNQLFEIIATEVGVAHELDVSKLPRAKDGDSQDVIDHFLAQAKNSGFILTETTPENLKMLGNTPTSKVIDLSQTQKIQSRINLAAFAKQECLDLVGISRQRQGNVLATETATATNTALTQSYAQTEPIFAQHEYVLNQLYQAIIDAAQYIEVRKPNSTITYLNSEGDSEFLRAVPEDLKMKDFNVFVTSRAEDQRIFQKMESLAGPMLQNGATPYDIAVMYSTSSVRMMMDTYKRLKDKQDEMQAQQQQIEQQKIQQQQEAIQMQIEAQKEADIANKEYESSEKELDRINKKEIAIISSLGFGKVQGQDSDNNGVPDILETEKIDVERTKIHRQSQQHLQEQLLKAQTERDKINLGMEKLKVERERTQADLKMKQMDIKNKPKTKGK